MILINAVLMAYSWSAVAESESVLQLLLCFENFNFIVDAVCEFAPPPPLLLLTLRMAFLIG